MAAKDNQVYVDLNYCVEQYFKKNFSPIVSSVSKELKGKQEEEARQIRQESQKLMMMDSDPGAAFGQAVMTERRVKRGEWNSKKTEDLMKMCNEKFFHNKNFQHDFQVLATEYRTVFKKQLGEKEYDRLSKGCKKGDLATEYVFNRFQRLMLEQLAKQGVPKSSLEYIMKKGFENSLAGQLFQWSFSEFRSETDEALDKLTEKMYDPSVGEKMAGGAVSFVTDFATTGGLGASGVTGWSLTGLDLLSQMGLPFLGTLEDDEKDLTYEKRGLVQAPQKKADPAHSDVIYHVNGQMKASFYSGQQKSSSFYKDEIERWKKEAPEVFTDDASKFRDIIENGVDSKTKLASMKAKEIPGWMMEKTESTCIKNAHYFTALAAVMSEHHRDNANDKIKVGKTTLTYDQVLQRGYDYARAAELKQQQRIEMERQQEQQEQETAASQTSSANSEVQAASVAAQDGGSPKFDAWGGLLDSLGLKGIGGIGKNFNYIIAMLPNLLIGLFTGKLKNMKLGDNLWPIAAIIGGFFVKNPLMKMLLIGLGGANILNKVNKNLTGEAAGQQMGAPTYVAYADEPLNARLKDPVIRGNTMLLNIDNIPCHITISDTAIDAYEKGKLPLNTLANAVLRNYDRQQDELASQYEQQMAEGRGRNEEVKLR